MVRIAISQAAFDAIARTMPLGSVGYENEANEKGEPLIWLPHDVLGKLNRYWGNWGEPGRYTGGDPAPVSGCFGRAFKPVTVTLPEGRQRSTRTCPK